MRPLSWFVILPAILLSLLSLVILSSIAPDRTVVQALFIVIAILMGWGVFAIGMRNLLFIARPIYASILVLLFLTMLVGGESRGSRRWLGIGPFKGQTSEFAKPILLLSLTAFLVPPWPRGARLQMKRFARAVALMAPIVVFIFRQPDLGTAAIVIMIAAVVIFFSCPPRWLLLVSLGMFLLFVPLSRFVLQDYQRQRVEVFLNPSRDPRGAGYSVIQSMISIGSGQVIGRGLGHGTQSQLRFLPERQTDFIFASIVEELGLLGGVIALTLFATMMIALTVGAFQSTEKSCFLTLAGCAGWLFFQSAANVAMTMGLVPVTGITLPFLSAGGSSLLSSGIMLSLAVSAIETPRDFRYHRPL